MKLHKVMGSAWFCRGCKVPFIFVPIEIQWQGSNACSFRRNSPKHAFFNPRLCSSHVPVDSISLASGFLEQWAQDYGRGSLRPSARLMLGCDRGMDRCVDSCRGVDASAALVSFAVC